MTTNRLLAWVKQHAGQELARLSGCGRGVIVVDTILEPSGEVTVEEHAVYTVAEARLRLGY